MLARLTFLGLSLSLASSIARADSPETAKVEFFEKKIRPMLANHF